MIVQLDRESERKELALSKGREILEELGRWRQLLARYEESQPSTDDYHESGAALHVSSTVILAKCQSLSSILDDSEEEEPELLLLALEGVRRAWGRNGKPLPVSQYLQDVAESLKISAAELPTEGTYRRWLGELQSHSVRMSPALKSAFRRFLATIGNRMQSKN